MPVRTVACPNCGTPVVWQPENPFRPFCSERCKMADLGAWANEKYKVPIPADDPDESFEDEDKDA